MIRGRQHRDYNIVTTDKTFTPNQLSKIPLKRTTGEEVLPGNTFSTVVLSSAGTNWQNVVVEEHHFRTREFKKNGHFQRIPMPKDAISLSPSQRPFFRRSIIADNASADVLFVALDPVFVSQTAASLEVYLDRVELVEQQRETDPAIRHIALALLGGMQDWHAGDMLYGESLSTALVIHLLREYGGTAPRPQGAPRGLPREKLLRAVEYIQDQLHEDLTVAG